MRIAIDVDGVLVDMGNYLLEYGSKYFLDKYNIPIKFPNGYEISEMFLVSQEKDHEFWLAHINHYGVTYEARYGAAEIIKKLKEEGNEIIIMTARGGTEENTLPKEEMQELVKSWLKRNDIVYDELEKKIRKNEFTLDDYLAQLKQIKKMGSFSSILKMLPGMNQLKDAKVDDKEFVKIEAIICSMTKAERKNPKILNGSRRLRISKGSGTTVQQINQFMKTFEVTQKMMKQMNSEKGMKGLMRNLKGKGLDVNSLKDFKM